MKLPSHLVNLEYDPAHDVLRVEWAGYDRALPSELQYALEEVMAALRHYDISNLLLDARGTTGEPAQWTRFLEELRETRVRRVALLVRDAAGKSRAVRQARELEPLPYLVHPFVRGHVALGWLSA